MRHEIHCLAVVNRGEAAMRCVRAVKTLRALEGSDIRSLALYTEIERDAPFVRHADLAVALRPAANEVAAYLDHDGIVEALRRGGADAVWPGWGFVAEDPLFVERLEREGIAFLGPSASAMRALGDKIAAKELAEANDVPVSPWSGRAVDGDLDARSCAERIGFPLVIKAAAGGGGRGIRIVDERGALTAALRSARAEAAAAFGDDRLLLERKVEGGRHVEVQIAADRHGNVFALGCRDCSVQRRHQKLIEEAPPPGLAPRLLRALESDAVRLARAVDYSGVGTVEFLVAGDQYYFLEVNPRLQVEHGVTESITGLDLVQLQIRIARGEEIRTEVRGRIRTEVRGLRTEPHPLPPDAESADRLTGLSPHSSDLPDPIPGNEADVGGPRFRAAMAARSAALHDAAGSGDVQGHSDAEARDLSDPREADSELSPQSSSLSPEHAIEARLCADDPDAGFLPAPGRIARFDPSLGPRVRIDTGVTTGSIVPAAFDSLVAKVIATGATREEARARLVSALADFDLVIEGGATNKGFLLDALSDEEFRRGGVDTGWLDRFAARRSSSDEGAVEGLIAASILAYQRARALARLNFYADTTTVTPARVPPSVGQSITLTHRGQTYQLEVYAVGSWRYRVYLGDQIAAVTLREESANAARLEIGGRVLRVLHDAGVAGVRLEIDGRPHRFGWDAAGQVRAGTPAMVVAIEVEVGAHVEAGQSLGLLEAMKMEIGFTAPVSGTVTEIRVRKGQQVRAGDVLLVIDAGESHSSTAARRRLRFPDSADPLAPLFAPEADGGVDEPDLGGGDTAEPAARRAAIAAVREEVRRVFLGYDVHAGRAERLASLLEAEVWSGLSASFRRELAEIRAELATFADVEELFVAAPVRSATGDMEPSNAARLRMFVRRLHAGGAGIAPRFLDLVRRALSHYGVQSLEPGDALERAVLRLLASQRSPNLRHQLLVAVIHHASALSESGVELREDRALRGALERITAMRGLVSHAVADAAAEAVYVIFERPAIEEQAARASAEVDLWLQAAADEPTPPPEAVLRSLAEAPRRVFDRVGSWLRESDARHRLIALEAHLRRLYGPRPPAARALSQQGGLLTARLTFAAGREVFACACAPERVIEAVSWLRVVAESPRAEPPALELFVALADGDDAAHTLASVRAAWAPSTPAGRLTLTLLDRDGALTHHLVAPAAAELHGLHPETAAHIDLGRLAHFELERCEAPDGVYCFRGRSREERGDERVFVVAEARTPATGESHEPGPLLPAVERAFMLATRTLRSTLSQRDPQRRLQWNRITLIVAAEVFLDRDLVGGLARRLAPQTRHLGLEKVVVSLRRLDRDAPERAAEPLEIVVADVTGSNLAIEWRAPDRNLVQSRSDYERRVADARRRRLVYPYEIARMLTGGGATGLPPGVFEEYDLDAEGVATPVARPYGLNQCAIVFGVITTPTEKVPEGMRRVLVLSDPTRGMGALAAAECDRVAAAIDLAERLRLPLEWVPISGGARIAMDSGTENLDATARVVRRIVSFTQGGGVIHVIVYGVSVGAQSYWNALATMLMHTRGVLVMTAGGSMVLTGKAALEASGGVSAADELGIGGFEGIMGPNGEAQYYAADLADAYRILYEHYRYTYVVPGEERPRPQASEDSALRPLDGPTDGGAGEFERVAEIFDHTTNPGRKRAFPMRAVMAALVDRDGGALERWRSWSGAETAIVWDAHLGGTPVCLIGIESQNVTREGYRPLDGPASWSGGTLFPQSSKKVARALNAASGNRPVVVLANLSGFDGSPESMRKLQLEYGAEIARAVVNFEGPILFLVVSRYHGGAYVVFSRELNPGLRVAALEGSFASVIGGGPAAAVVFTREVRARAAADARVRALREEMRRQPGDETRARLERAEAEAMTEAQAKVAAEFDAVHSVERALAVGSLDTIVEPRQARAFLIEQIRAAFAEGGEAQDAM